MKIRAIAFILICSFIMTFAGCTGENNIINKDISIEIDYGALIDGFKEKNTNAFKLNVGDTHTPDAAAWLENGKGKVYVSNESVVTVDDKGVVTAVGEGVAFVVISSYTEALSMVYRYTVFPSVPDGLLDALPKIDGIDFEGAIKFFEENSENTVELKVGETHTHIASAWAKTGECYTSNEAVATVDENGVVTAVGEGTAYILIKSKIGVLFKVCKYTVKA